ncbi:MAG: hypothetical protein ABI779_27415 [Acidobacteriota bacterium]
MRGTLVLLTISIQFAMVSAAHTAPPERRGLPLVAAAVSLPHAKVLAGVPFDIVVTLTNVSSQPATVGLVATLVVTFSDGRTAVLHERGENDQWLLEPHDEMLTSVQLAPGESVQKVAGWDRGSIPNWARYDSFSGPGNYEIALELSRGFRDDEYSDHVNYVGTLRTSSAHLERFVPLGKDEVLWNRMKETAGGRWSDNSFAATKVGVALAREIVELHPDSSYYPYALLLYRRFKNRDDLPALLAAAERFSASPSLPYLWKAAADAALYEAQDPHSDDASSGKFYDLAEAYYQTALATGSLGVRGGAEKGARRANSNREKVKSP